MKTDKRFGSAAGLVISLVIGFVFYFGMQAIGGSNEAWAYGSIVDGIADSVPKQLQWFLMDFTEAQFYAGVFAGAGVIVGGIVAWILAVKGSKYAGFDVCYGSSTLFPWVLASQLLSLALAIFVFRYIDIFRGDGVTWAATFITVVGAPPAVMLLYGPSISALLTSSILGGLICAPVATTLQQMGTPSHRFTMVAYFGYPLPRYRHRCRVSSQGGNISDAAQVSRDLAHFSRPYSRPNLMLRVKYPLQSVTPD